MLALEKHHVHMNQQATNKAQALQCLLDILVADQLVTADYLHGLESREQQAATYLGQGIAIPHGTPQSRDCILSTGVRLAHFPQGVLWDDSHKVYLAIVIAAKSDEHLQVLQLLTRALSSQIETQLQQATEPEQILALLAAQAPSLSLHENLIATQLPADDVEDLFWHASKLLKQQQMVETGFQSALDCAQLIPLADNLWSISCDQHVRSPAVAIVQSQQQLSYQNQGLETLVCIAHNSQLDQQLLDRLIDLLFDPSQQRQLQHKQPRQIAEQIGAELIPDWPSASVILANAHGLHARPATQLVNLCKPLHGEIKVSVDQGPWVSAKSLTKLLSLGCKRGQRLCFIAEPNSDAAAQLTTIIAAVTAGLGEEVEALQPTDAASQPVVSPILKQSFSEQDISNKGIAASAGLAFGPAHVIKARQFEFERYAHSLKQEHEKLEIAIHSVKNSIRQLIAKSDLQAVKQIFMAHLELLDDPELIDNVHRLMADNLSAAAAWQQHIHAAAQAQAALSDVLLAERAADLRDIGERVLAVLCGAAEIQEPASPYILVKQDIGPSDVARLDKQRVAGILTAVGGASAHSAIVARALGIPAVVGAGSSILNIADHAMVLINGDNGEFVLDPDQAMIDQALAQRQRLAEIRAAAEAQAQQPAITVDGHAIEIAANIGKIQATAQAVADGAEAIGLLRTELVFMQHQTAPDVDRQEVDYRQVLDDLAGRPLVVRTLDVGGDKPLPYLPIPAEDNPFLGIRGIRLTLRQPELLRQQLIALLKAAAQRPLRIMFPMIARLEEWRAAKAILDQVLLEYPCKDLQVGIMIEVPSAALLAPILAKEVDFFSIGTNDLTQYTLAIDRGHPILSAEADGLHPSVLSLIAQTVQAAHAEGKWVGICGELAADAKAVPILLGLQVDELSMSSSSIPLVKAQIRSLNFAECQQLADQALSCGTASEVRQLRDQSV